MIVSNISKIMDKKKIVIEGSQSYLGLPGKLSIEREVRLFTNAGCQH